MRQLTSKFMRRKLLVPCALVLLLLVATFPEGHGANCFAQEQSKATTTLDKYDEFRHANCEEELAHLDGFYNHLQNNPDAQGYVIVYGGRTGEHYEAQGLAARMRFYLTHTRGLDGRRLMTIDGGHRETLTTEFWVGRRGEPMPAPTPTLTTKDLSLKGRASVFGYDCGARLGL